MFNKRAAAKSALAEPAATLSEASTSPPARSFRFSVRTGALALGALALSAVSAHAGTGGETFTADPTAYAGTMTDTGTFATSLIATYAPKAIEISVAIGAVGLVWGWARRAIGH